MTDGSADEEMPAAETRARLVEGVPARRRLAIGAVGLLFWCWLLARWAVHNSVLDGLLTALGFPDLVHSEIGVRPRAGWIPAAPFESAATTVASLAEWVDVTGAGILDGLATWFAGAFELVGLPVVRGPIEGLFGLVDVAVFGFAEWFLGGLVWLLQLGAFATEVAPALAAGAYVTIYLTILSLMFGLVIAIPLAVARTYGGKVLRAISLSYTELIRGTPLLAQLFFLYYGLPTASLARQIGFTGHAPIPRAAAVVAVVGFTINSSAYQSEYIRSGLESVDAGQMTAARSVGLSKAQAIRHVVLPQGLRLALPGWTNEFIYLLKYSSMAAFITVPDLFQQASNIGSDTFQFTDIYVIVALFYLGLVLTTALAMAVLESAIAIPGLEQSRVRD